MTRRKKTLLWLAIFVIVIAVLWGFIAGKDYFNNLKYKPVLNPNPQHFMTIHGHVSPELIGKVRLKWVAVYASSDARCDVMRGELEGAISWRWIDVPYIIKPSASGNYSVKIPLDYYQPGYCKWQIIDIEDHTGNAPESEFDDIAQFYPCGTSATCIGGNNNVAPNPLIYSLKATMHNICYYKAQETLSCGASPYYSFSNNGNIPRNHNYDFIETYDLSK